MTNPLRKESSQAIFTSGLRASEWAQIARDRGYTAQAKEWEKAEREGWDEQHFSLSRRDDLANKFPGSFGR